MKPQPALQAYVGRTGGTARGEIFFVLSVNPDGNRTVVLFHGGFVTSDADF